jgi:hypothetical protein
MKDYYKVLGVPSDATLEQIKVMYHGLAKLYHDDKTELDLAFAHEKMVEIQEAYEVLSDPEKRAEYDRQRLPQPQVHPIVLDFGSVRKGASCTQCFTVSNAGGPVQEINFTSSAGESWFRIKRITPLSKVDPCLLDVEVTAETQDLLDGHSYGGWIVVDFDGIAARIGLKLHVAAMPKAASPLPPDSYPAVPGPASTPTYAKWAMTLASIVILIVIIPEICRLSWDWFRHQFYPYKPLNDPCFGSVILGVVSLITAIIKRLI